MFTQNARTSLDLSKQQLREIRNKYKQDTTENEQDVLDKATEQYETDEEKCNAMKEISRNLLKENNDLKAEVNTLKGNVETAATTNNTCYDRIKELENELQE